jgi:hypothetical protein
MDILTSIHGKRLGLGKDGSLVLNHGANQTLVPVSKVVDVTAATLTVTRDAHAGRLVTLNRAAGVAVTLPDATGSGDEYEFVIGTTITSNATTIKVPDADNTMVGWVSTATTTAGAGLQEAAGGTDDTISMNGTTTGGIVGSYVKVKDIAANLWLVDGKLVGSGVLATSLSATVS